MSKLTPTLPLDGFEKEWSDLTIKEYYIGELVSLACVLGKESAFNTKFKSAFKKDPPKPNEMIEIDGGYAIWSGQGQYMLLLLGENIHADSYLQEKFKDTAYATLQSDGWASLAVTGHSTFNVLERFIPLDIRGAPNNFAARTSAHHLAVIVLKFSDAEFQLLTPRSSAHSFLDGLVNTTKNVLG